MRVFKFYQDRLEPGRVFKYNIKNKPRERKEVSAILDVSGAVANNFWRAAR